MRKEKEVKASQVLWETWALLELLPYRGSGTCLLSYVWDVEVSYLILEPNEEAS